jgi:GNAT superfamily N-acetyltransferase
MNIRILVANYLNQQHAHDLMNLLNYYALDPMGGGKKLNEFVKQNLVSELAKIRGSLSLLCYVDGKPAGLVNCFEGFSTFNCQYLLNIHDVIVLDKYRGLGLSQKLLEKVEEIAKNKGYCKLTLEVLEGNEPAKKAYLKYGFSGYELAPEVGKALFWEKQL